MQNVVHERAAVDNVALSRHRRILELDRLHVCELFLTSRAVDHNLNIIRTLHIAEQLVPAVQHLGLGTVAAGVAALYLGGTAKFQIAERLRHVRDNKFQFHKKTSKF